MPKLASHCVRSSISIAAFGINIDIYDFAGMLLCGWFSSGLEEQADFDSGEAQDLPGLGISPPRRWGDGVDLHRGVGDQI